MIKPNLPVCSLLCFLKKYLVVKVFLQTSHSQHLLSWSLAWFFKTEVSLFTFTASLLTLPASLDLQLGDFWGWGHGWKLEIWKFICSVKQFRPLICICNFKMWCAFGPANAYLHLHLDLNDLFYVNPMPPQVGYQRDSRPSRETLYLEQNVIKVFNWIITN